MELKIIHFYPDLMSLYGSYANVSVLRRYLAGGGLTGAIALLGPTRMPFEQLVPVLDYFALKLGECMAGKAQEDPQ